MRATPHSRPRPIACCRVLPHKGEDPAKDGGILYLMKRELEESLAAEFPFMRRGLTAEEQKERWGGVRDLYSGWGLEMGSGWFQLIWDLCAEIRAAYEEAGATVDIVVDQAKEKWGGLRFYWHPRGQKVAIHAFDCLGGPSFRAKPGSLPVHAKVDEIVRKYEEKSTRVCERCGAPGVLRTDLGYVCTLCDEHHQECLERLRRPKEPEKSL